MSKNPVLDLPLSEVLRPEIALSLQHVLQLYTVGNFLRAWKSPKSQRSIEQIFDTREQARHAAQVCATWLGVPVVPTPQQIPAWWRGDERSGTERISA
jgi:hypothetical protein